MIVLTTDFGLNGPYIGQMKAVLYRMAPGVPVIDLFSDAPLCAPRATAYLLAAYYQVFPEGSVFLSVVDPGVGGPRGAVIVRAAGRYFVGPDNGLFSVVVQHLTQADYWAIDYPGAQLSNSFHGRDLFAPVAAVLARGDALPGTPITGLSVCPEWPDDLNEIVYLDHYGNAITGYRASQLDPSACIRIGKHRLPHARTFCEQPPGQGFWYANANGLVEIAVNQGSARQILGLALGDRFSLTS